MHKEYTHEAYRIFKTLVGIQFPETGVETITTFFASRWDRILGWKEASRLSRERAAQAFRDGVSPQAYAETLFFEFAKWEKIGLDNPPGFPFNPPTRYINQEDIQIC